MGLKWLEWSRKLAAIAQNGLAYAKDPFDVERYSQLREIAAEILAGALKDNGRATVVGETSYGKGSVQQVQPLDKGGFKITIARYYTPDGKNIDKIGIVPDKVVTEPALTDAEQQAIQSLTENGTITAFIAGNPNPDDQAVSSFIAKLKANGTDLPDRVVRKLVKNEIDRTNNNPPVYDLQFDTVLQEAVQMLNAGAVTVTNR